MNKKPWCFSALVVMLLAACGGSSSPPSQASPPPSSSQPAGGKQSASPGAETASATPHAATQQRALVLGGGGPLGRAWQIGLLKGLKDAGIDVTQADLLLGTSAGSILGTQIRAGKALDSLYGGYVASVSAPASAAGPLPYDPAAAQEVVRPVTSLTSAADLNAALRIEVGKRALAVTKVVSEDAQIQAAAASLGDIHDWPQQPLWLAAGDAQDGTIHFFDRSQGVPIERAVAASTANPQQGKTPMTVGGRRYMDGAVGGTNLDGATGYGAIVALLPPALVRPEVAKQQVETMRSKGQKIVALEPDADSLAAMGPDRFDTSRAKPTAESGLRQAESVAAEIRSLWMSVAPAADLTHS